MEILGQLREVPQTPAGHLSPSQPWNRHPPGHAHHVFVPSHNFLLSRPAGRPPQASSVGPLCQLPPLPPPGPGPRPRPCTEVAPRLDPFTPPAACGLPRIPRGPSHPSPGCSHSQLLPLPSKFRGVFDPKTFIQPAAPSAWVTLSLPVCWANSLTALQK